jgi:mannose-6-phosphate isomerase class I
MPTLAEALLHGGPDAAAPLASKLIKPLRNNFVERPWGGMRMRAFKGLCPLPDQARQSGLGLGEAFEIAAFDDDDEARAHPSMLRFEDGSRLSLPALLERHAETLLGEPFTARYGRRFPLLPKTLDVKELLSVQGHPEGHTEVYVIIDAEPGATLRVGFNQEIDGETLKEELIAGRHDQEALLEALGSCVVPADLQALCGPWLAERGADAGDLLRRLGPSLADADAREARALLERLKTLYWRVLDLMNAIRVVPGQVIHNATPPRLTAVSGNAPSAEVHALGNPEGLEIVALEIRRPGPTFRAWDNVRFPVRPVDVGGAVDALNLHPTSPEEFLVEPAPVTGRRGAYRSVDSPSFRLDHLRPALGQTVEVDAEPPHTLHVLGGSLLAHDAQGRTLASLERGESALVPAGVGAYALRAEAAGCEVVKVSLPLEGTP